MASKGSVALGLLERAILNLLGKMKLMYTVGTPTVAPESGYSTMYLYQYSNSTMFQLRTQNEFQNGLRRRLVRKPNV